MPATKSEGARFRPSSDQTLLVYFDRPAEKSRAPGRALPNSQQPQQSRITREANEKVRRLLGLLEQEPITGVRNLHPAYSSLLIKFDALQWRHVELEKILQKYLKRLQTVRLPEAREVEIPVCYGGEHGPDLEEVAALHDMTAEKVIELHASVLYLVYFMGFVPGFAYLGELPEALATPRLGTPRKKVPAGSVGIAGTQTGVYPFATPGGWRLLGRTPLAMFRADRRSMSLVSIGDSVRFAPISRERFNALVNA